MVLHSEAPLSAIQWQILIVGLACLQAVCGCLYRGKTPENAEFAIAGTILDSCKNRSGVNDKATGRGRGSEKKTACPKTRLMRVKDFNF